MTASDHTSASEHLDLVALPPSAGLLAFGGNDQWTPEWISSQDGYDVDQMREYGRACVAAALSPKGTSGSDELDGWQPIETAPKDGNEFLAIWGNQGNVVQVVKWNHIHKFWQSKGEPIAGFATNATRWHALPAIAAQAEGGETS